MKPQQIYQSLKDLSEKLGITVTEQSFKNAGIKVKSGLCRVHDEWRFVMDMHRPVQDKIDLLAECLCEMNHETIYLIPAVRDLLNKKRQIRFRNSEMGDPGKTIH